MVSKTDLVSALKGLTIWLVQLNNKELTSLLSSSRLYCKCFTSINPFGPHRLNDEVSIWLLSIGTIIITI